MNRRIVAVAGSVFGLVMSSHVSAQNFTAPPLALNGVPALSTTGSGSWNVPQAQNIDWKSSAPIPGSPDRFTAPANVHLELKPISNSDALRRLPFYVTAPYWLPRSRTFGKTNNDITAPQPTATHGALASDIATLVRSVSPD